MNRLSRSQFWLTRAFTATFGICSIAWAISSLSAYQAEASFVNPARGILSGESYSIERLNVLKRQLDVIPAKLLRSSALNDVAVIRLRLVEGELATGSHQIAAPSLANLEAAATAALAQSPRNSFLWLIEYWIRDLRGGATAGDLQFLRMSYLSGPNEAWIALRRNPIALSVFSSLPPEIANRVLSEFEGLVRSNFYQEASNIIAGPGWAVHEKLLSRLVQIKEADRRAFAKVLASKNLEGAVVPGIEADERHSRSF